MLKPLFMLLGCLFLVGCNSMHSTLNPTYESKVIPVSRIGVAGDGASPASQAFMEAGYDVIDLGQDSSAALSNASRRGVPYVAVVEPVGTEGSWWDGFFDFAMRVTDTRSGKIVWSANAEYGSGGIFINQDGSTKKAMHDMVLRFSEHFPPK